jgi:hypothetical protein
MRKAAVGMLKAVAQHVLVGVKTLRLVNDMSTSEIEDVGRVGVPAGLHPIKHMTAMLVPELMYL